jgi:hypothetical protein
MKGILLTTVLSILAILTTLSNANAQGSPAHIQSVEMRQKKVDVHASRVVLVRTHRTPKKVKVKLTVAMKGTVCVREATRMITRQDGAYCGYHTTSRRSNCRRQCVRFSACPSNSLNCRKRCVRYENRCDIRQIRVENTCTYPQTHCVERDVVVTGSKSSNVSIKFKNLPGLRVGEQEIFVLDARQSRISGSNIEFSLKARRSLQDYKIKVKDFFADRITVKQ